MTTPILIDPATDPRWDPFVENHPFGQVGHLSVWKSILEKSFSHIKGYCFALTDPAGGSITAALPVYTVKSWLTGNRLVSVPFATLCDPLVSDEKEAELLITAANRFARDQRCRQLEITTFHSRHWPVFNQFNQKQVYLTHHLDLRAPLDDLYKRMHRSTRYSIQRARKEGFTLTAHHADSDTFYELYRSTRKQLCLPAQPPGFFSNLISGLAAQKKLCMIIAFKRTKPVAGLLCFRHAGRFSAEFNGWDRAYSRQCPNYLVWWEAIVQAKKAGCHAFDFGRTSPANTGLAVFKDKWATTRDQISLWSNQKPRHRPAAAREFSPAYTAAQLVCKHLPPAGYRYFSKFCYRHLG